MNNFPDRPTHKDFWKLSEIVIKNDTSAEEDEDFEVYDTIARFVDPESLEYMATQRISRVAPFSPMLLAIYVDAFLLGAEFEREKK